MILSDFGFRDYFHQYMIIEADALTDVLRGSVFIDEHDCYMLCSSYVRKDGLLAFNVLSVGDAWDHCRKGLNKKQMLGIFYPEQIGTCNARKIYPDLAMMHKNIPWIAEQESWTSNALQETREEPRLDSIRNVFMPDIVKAGILTSSGIHEYDMQAQYFDGPFLNGKLMEKTNVSGYEKGRKLYTLPYGRVPRQRLLVVFSGDPLSEDDQQARLQLIEDSSHTKFGFCGHPHAYQN